MKFICDVMLGRLARYLRILGLDSPYIKNPANISTFLKDADAPYFFTKRTKTINYERTVRIKSDHIMEQLVEIEDIIAPFVSTGKIMSRCIECNVPLIETARESIEHLVPEYVYHFYKDFKRCPSCGRVYWGGTHTEKMRQWIQRIAQG